MDSLPVNLTDIVVLAILLIAGGIAFALGFVRVLLLIGAWIGAAVVTLYGFSTAGPIARRYIEVALVADIVAGVVLFIASLVTLFVVAMVVSAAVRRLGLGALDRALGFVFGVAGGAVIVCLIYLGVVWAGGDEKLPDWMAEAR
ncbi:MAG: CvpA family protein, partial [Alphaproteobacteria bacterium]